MSDDDKLRNSLRPGHRLHWYRIEKILGQGGFGITYLAYDTNLDQHVAVKEYLPMELAVREGDFSVYPASRAQDSRYKWGLERFLSEARTLARFKHPAIVRVLSVFEANNTAYMVMEYQHGMSLQEVLDRRGTLPEDELVAMTVPLLDGLETIHAQGFIHRDIKPSNVFIRTDGQPVLLDFGSARQALGEETKTLTSVVSPGYAPFEQYYSKSDRQGPWTDIYGLGATLYRCLSGLQPMAAIDRSEAILKAERDVFVSAAELGGDRYSPSFLRAVDAALHFNEKKRPQSIAEWRPYFDFSTTVDTLLTEPVNTRYPENAPTRFSAVVAEPPSTPQTEVINHDAVASRGRTGDPRSARPAVSRPASVPPS
ncbi:MAG: serine/threonine-protein kinase, partial [Gammaproteobacteria bacterium]